MKIALVLLTAAVLFAAPAIASAASATTVFPWQGDDTQMCGPACIYRKANETISLQAVYIMRKIALLQAHPDKIQANAPNFCDTTNSESDDDCLKRYIRIQRKALIEIRGALVANAEKASLLDSHSTVFASPSEEMKKPQTPYVSDLNDLRRDYAQLPPLAREDADRFADRETEAPSRRPSRDEFIQFHEIPRDPGNPSAGTLTVADKDYAGRHVIDEVRYQAALREWSQAGPSGQTGEDLANADRRVLHANIARGVNRPRGLDAATESESRQAFNQARGLVVESARNALVHSGVAVTSNFRPVVDFTNARRNNETRRLASRADAPGDSLNSFTGTERVPDARVVPGSRDAYFSVTISPQDIQDEVDRLSRAAF